MLQQHNSASVSFLPTHMVRNQCLGQSRRRAAGSPVEKGRKYLAGGKRPYLRQRSKDPKVSLFLLNLRPFSLSFSSLLANRVVKYSTTKRSTTLSTTRAPLDKHVRSAASSTSCVIKHQRRRQSRRHRRRRRSTTAAIDSHVKSHQPFKVCR